jgi:hypothetical protein
LISPGKNIFSRHKEFFDRSGKSALEQHGSACLPHRTQQIEVLHVARADLQHIHIVHHEINLDLRHNFNDDGQSRFLARFGKEFQSLFAEALK